MTAAAAQRPLRVLVASVGLAPQVVTETLHALWRGEAWLPDRLVLIATPRSAELARALLLDPEGGALVAWGCDWKVPGAERLAAEAQIAVADSDSGDIDAEHDAMAFAECAWRVLRDLTADGAAELHVSIAGGRKAQAALIAILMTVLGRPQDRLSHVLVRPEEAAAAGLFYPAPACRPVLVDGAILDAAALGLHLINIPFPRLSLGSEAAGELCAFFERLTQQARPVRLTVDLDAGRVLWDGRPMGLSPALAAFLAWLGREQAQGLAGIPRVGAPRAGFLASYRAFAGAPGAASAAARLPDPLDPEWIEEKAARINRAADGIGARPRGARLVQRVGNRAQALYRLALDPGEIAVLGAWGAPA